MAAERRTPALDARSGLTRLAGYPFQILTWVQEDGYPMSVAIVATLDADAGTATFDWPTGLADAPDGDVSLTGSHIRPQPGYGYDERRHVTVWGRLGRATPAAAGRVVLEATAAWGWDERETPFFEYSERSVSQSRKYFDALSTERGTPVRPKLSLGSLVLRTTRLPFLSAAIVPVAVGIAIAASNGFFDLATAILTLVGAAFVQLAANTSNDVFDAAQGADDANVTPTKFSGGSRVIQYGLVSFRRMAALSATFYVAAAATGLVLLAMRGSETLLAIGVVGLVIALGYTAPPLKLAYRGLGEVAIALGFGPLMLLGAYAVQTGGPLDWEPVLASVPVALLVALILYVNEIPDRRGDARAGKLTLPVRLSQAAVIRGYGLAVIAAFGAVVAGVLAGVLPVVALLVLVAAPLARRVHAGLRANYDNPYGMMAVMAVNIRLHLAAGILLLVAYAIVLLATILPGGVSLFLR